MPPDLTLTLYGGAPGDDPAGEIGGNKILLEFAGRAYFLDFGTRFAVSGRFFEEFFQELSSPPRFGAWPWSFY